VTERSVNPIERSAKKKIELAVRAIEDKQSNHAVTTPPVLLNPVCSVSNNSIM